MTSYFPKETFHKTVALLGSEFGAEEGMAISYQLVERIFGISKTDIIVNSSFHPEPSQIVKYESMMQRLLDHEPIQYLFNEVEFYGYSFYVDKNVLIPRQETELLIQIIANSREWYQPKIADIGTGSGCIACSLALSIKEAIVRGYDLSKAALLVAQKNAERLQAKVDFSQLDILEESLPETNFDLIVSNPPYVTQREKIHMKRNVLDYEPALALFVPDQDPLRFYKKIMVQSKIALKPGGMLFFEINEHFGKELLLLFQHHGYTAPKIYKDLNDKQRFATAVWK